MSDQPERRVTRGCIGIVIVALSALFVHARQTGWSVATIALIAVLIAAIVAAIAINIVERKH
ncbi:MAG: hypothetical protein RMJ48_14940 [Roseiflexaceae bacterium]|nr:hypothetical protein [Roseiflexaceae bacterium]